MFRISSKPGHEAMFHILRISSVQFEIGADAEAETCRGILREYLSTKELGSSSNVAEAISDNRRPFTFASAHLHVGICNVP